MKHLKIFELFSIKPAYSYTEEETVDENKYVIFSFKTDKYLYDVIFEKWFDGWSAEHKIGNPFTYSKLKLTYDNVFKITSTVMCITKEFIDRNKPNFLIINYVGTPGESLVNIEGEKTKKDINKINKRARLQRNYLRQIDGYTPKYYYRANPENGTLSTCCLFYKNGYNITDMEKRIYNEYKFVDI